MRVLDPGWNRERWEQLPEDGNRYEVIDEALFVSTSPSLFHQWILQQLFDELRVRIDQRGLGSTWMGSVGVFMPGCDPVEPDLLVVGAEQRELLLGKRIEGVPALIVEVLSPSHPELDSVIKYAANARAGVPEYWMVRPATRDVMVCWEPRPEVSAFGQARLFAGDDELVSSTLPVRFRAGELFAGAPSTII